jgi:lipopolysaccharide export system permease protein
VLLLRYVARELLVPLAAWVGSLWLLLFALQALKGSEILLGSAVTLADVGRLLLYLTPHFLVMALPVASLLAILLGLGRLSEDRELLAMQALGLGPSRVMAAAVAMGGAAAGLMVLLSFTGQPWGLRAVHRMAGEVIRRNVIGDVRPGVFYEDLTQLTLYTEQVDAAGQRWTNVLIHDARQPEGLEADGDHGDLLVLARRAAVAPAGGSEALRLTLGEGHVHRADRSTGEYARIGFERGEVAVGMEDSIHRKNPFRSPKQELTPAELLEVARAEEARPGGEPIPWRMAFHRRLGQALSPIAFALLGAPLAMARRPGGRARGFLLTIAGYVGYYVLYRFFEQLAFQGRLHVAIAGQLANLILSAVGVAVFWRLSRRGAP